MFINALLIFRIEMVTLPLNDLTISSLKESLTLNNTDK
jgi:hypothetical protein